jgi:hypothetical protein
VQWQGRARLVRTFSYPPWLMAAFLVAAQQLVFHVRRLIWVG